MENTMPMNTCYQCGKNLTAHKEDYDWLILRGFSQKDASAKVLFDPKGKLPAQCCIVGLQTNLDPNKEYIERAAMKANIAQKEKEDRAKAGLPERIRQEVFLYVSDLTGQSSGRFILYDAEFDDVTILARNDSEHRSGFEITNIAPVPQYISDKEGWGKETPLALWSGNIKIVPVIHDGSKYLPAYIWTSSTSQPTDIYMTGFDKSFMGAEILEYSNMNVSNVGLNNMGQQVQYTVQRLVMKVRKQFPDKIF